MTSGTYQSNDVPDTGDDDNDDYLINSASIRNTESKARRRKIIIYGGIACTITIVLIIVIAVVVSQESGSSGHSKTSRKWPVMITTWGAGLKQRQSLYAGYQNLSQGGFSLEAVLAGVRQCQDTCGGNVGITDPNYNSLGGVTQNAMVIYGPTHDSGAVAEVMRVTDAVTLAYYTMLYTDHSLLVGAHATRFAMNFNETFEIRDIPLTPWKQSAYDAWIANACLDNFYKNVVEPHKCYPMAKQPISGVESHNDYTGCDQPLNVTISMDNSDSIAMIAVDTEGRFSLATSAGGMDKEIAGRVSDAAVVGSGGYVLNDVGACVATGNGDILQRFAPSRGAVTYMAVGYSPGDAAQKAIQELLDYHCDEQACVVCVDADGNTGSASIGGDIKYGKVDKDTPANVVMICGADDECTSGGI